MPSSTWFNAATRFTHRLAWPRPTRHAHFDIYSPSGTLDPPTVTRRSPNEPEALHIAIQTLLQTSRPFFWPTPNM